MLRGLCDCFQAPGSADPRLILDLLVLLSPMTQLLQPRELLEASASTQLQIFRAQGGAAPFPNPFVCILLLFLCFFPAVPWMRQAGECARVEAVDAFGRTPGRDGRNRFPAVEQRDVCVNLLPPPAELHLTYLLSYPESNILNKSLFFSAQPELQFFQSIPHFSALILMSPPHGG